jgi:hypothetical protein
MVGRVFAGFVVTFWLVTMASLVRLEFFPKPLSMDTVPSRRVLDKIFSNPEPAHLSVYYGDTRIGHFNVEITPVTVADTTQESPTAQKPQAYRVKSELAIMLSVFGDPSRLRLKGEGIFDSNYEIQRFDLGSHIGEDRVRVHGDKKTGKVDVKLTTADVEEDRTYDLNQLQGAGLAKMLGWPGLPNLNFLGVAGTTRASSNPQNLPVTTTSRTRLTIGDGTVAAYRIESKLDDMMWARVWVDEAGDILLVETSIGLRMEDYYLEKASGTNGDDPDTRSDRTQRSARP